MLKVARGRDQCPLAGLGRLGFGACEQIADVLRTTVKVVCAKPKRGAKRAADDGALDRALPALQQGLG